MQNARVMGQLSTFALVCSCACVLTSKTSFLLRSCMFQIAEHSEQYCVVDSAHGKLLTFGICCHVSKCMYSRIFLFSQSIIINFFGAAMELKVFVTIVIAFNLCERTMSADVVSAFVDNEIVPDAVDVAPPEEVKVENTK